MHYQPNQIEKNNIEQSFANSNYESLEKYTSNVIKKGCEDIYVYNLLAVACAKQKKFKPAEKYFLKVINLDPYDFDYIFNLASFYRENKEFEKSIQVLDKCLEIYPENIKAMVLASSIYYSLKEYNSSIKYLDKVLSIDPSNKDALNQRCALLTDTGKFQEALRTFHVIGKVSGYDNRIYENIGVCHIFLGNLVEGKKFLDLAGNGENITFNKCVIDLKLGNYKEGWIGFETGISYGARKLRDEYKKFDCLPIWNPKLHKKSVVVVGEQGIGDEIMFSPLLRDLSEKVDKIYLCCDPRLKGIFEKKYDFLNFLLNKKDFKKLIIESKIPIGSLPRFFRNSEEEFSKNNKFNNSIHFQRKPSSYRDNKKLIGLSWNTTNKQFRAERNIDLSQFIPILKNKNYNFLNLQYGNHNSKISEVENAINRKFFIDDNNDNMGNIDGLAKNIMKCDLVISIDNSTAHLSGYMNKETFLLLPFVSDWRWQEKRLDTPWYSSIKILRQSKKFDWTSTIEDLSKELINTS